jgi:hypothetical protein
MEEDEECNACRAKPWKYRLTEERTGVQYRYCESCYIHIVPTLKGVFKVEERRSTDK